MRAPLLSAIARELVTTLLAIMGVVALVVLRPAALREWVVGCAVLAVYALAVWALRHAHVGSIDTRLRSYLASTALLLSLLLVAALSYRGLGGPAGLLSSPVRVLLAILAIAGWAVILARCAIAGLVAYRRLTRSPRAAFLATRGEWGYGRIVLVLAVLWTPALVALLPGVVTYDGARQIDEWIGAAAPSLDFTYTPTNHHPWFATVWQGALLSAGMAVTGGDINGGLALHSFVLIAASLATYAAVVRRIQALTNRGWTIAALIFFGVFPHFADYAALYEKTGWYQLALLWFFMGAAEVALGSGTAVSRILLLGGAGALTALFRSNGVYVVVASLVVMAAFMVRRRGAWRSIVPVAGSAVAVVVVFGLWTSVALPRWDVQPASPAEALVVPLQQTARIVLEHGDELDSGELAAIDAVLPLEAIRAAYDPENGDGVKGLFPVDSFLITDVGIRKMQGREEWWRDDQVARDTSAFLRTWAALALRFPVTAVGATVNNTYLYVAPPLNRGGDVSLFVGGLPTYFVLANAYTPDFRPLAGEYGQRALTAYYDLWARTPAVNMIVNAGLYGWVVIALALGAFFWPRRARFMILAPVLSVWLINFAGARNGDFRYTVPLVAMLPLCLAVWFAVGRRPWAAQQREGGGSAGRQAIEA